MNTQPRMFHVLAKPTGAICNLDCKYCFFLSKETGYVGPKGWGYRFQLTLLIPK